MRNRLLILLAVSLALVLVLPLTGCGSGGSSGSEDSNATLDALMDKDPSAMSDELMSSGGWLGRASEGGTDYRVFEVTVDGSKAHLYYKAAGGEGSGDGLSLYIYDIEPFQFGQ